MSKEIQPNGRLRGGSEAAAVKSVVDRARIEGPDVYLEVLNDRLVWNKTSAMVQDLAIQEVARRLSPDFNFVETNIYSCGGQTHRIANFVHVDTNLKLNLIPGGTFTCGSPEDGFQVSFEETPSMDVNICPLLISETVITVEHWQRLMSEVPPTALDCRMPKLQLSLTDWQSWLNRTQRLRVPSETEWEYACRAGSQETWFFGNSPARLEEFAWPNSSNSINPVSQKKCNAFGLHDMLGNTWEWCADGWTPDYIAQNLRQKPQPLFSPFVVIRGLARERSLIPRPAIRFAATKGTRANNIACRAVADI